MAAASSGAFNPAHARPGTALMMTCEEFVKHKCNEYMKQDVQIDQILIDRLRFLHAKMFAIEDGGPNRDVDCYGNNRVLVRLM